MNYSITVYHTFSYWNIHINLVLQLKYINKCVPTKDRNKLFTIFYKYRINSYLNIIHRHTSKCYALKVLQKDVFKRFVQ